MEIDPEVIEHINWLKLYADQNRLSWEFLITHEPLSKEYFIRLNAAVTIGYSVEETRLVMGDTEPEFGMPLYVKHLTLSFKFDALEDADDIIGFCLDSFDFDPGIKIGTWDQPSIHNKDVVLKHFIQEIQ